MISEATVSKPLPPSHDRGPAAAQPARWSVREVQALLDLPLPELLYQAQTVHRQHHDPTAMELATLLSIKTGGCPEDCAYCPQSVHHDTGVKATKLMTPEDVRAAVRQARQAGAHRFCMGAAWRAPNDRDLDKVVELVRVVKEEGLQACCTLGMLTEQQAQRLAQVGLDYYNHNLDTAPELYGHIITTRDYEDRLQTLRHVREAGIRVCCGGIVGMGESRAGRAALIAQLANLEPYPESVPINQLVKVAGTPLADQPDLDPLEFVRTVAVARITMPKAKVRLSAGRRSMDESTQVLCFVAGANSIFYGDKLLVTGNADVEADRALLQRLGMRTHAAHA
ncbi:MAG: biotin synthase BioB [Tepidimonas ignava]|uniref:biotin synthase BioB n=1 Tax=Tepidimonas ignava TaxID=114249 RepID=UPI002A35306D|nr:biotin synthase BioB [Tepidimonas ignava]